MLKLFIIETVPTQKADYNKKQRCRLKRRAIIATLVVKQLFKKKNLSVIIKRIRRRQEGREWHRYLPEKTPIEELLTCLGVVRRPPRSQHQESLISFTYVGN